MKFYIGEVVDNKDPDKAGGLYVKFPGYNDNRPTPVAYTSPYYRDNAGGMIAIPEAKTQVICLHNEFPRKGEEPFYYFGSVVSPASNAEPKDQNPNYKPLRSNDPNAEIYGKLGGPVTQTFTNMDGNGLYIKTEYSGDKIPDPGVQAKASVEAQRLGFVTEATRRELENSGKLSNVTVSNNVTMKVGTGEEVNVGTLGVQIKNGEGDSIVINSGEPNDDYAARSLIVETQGNQEYKCIASDINMRVVDGGDINIENNSFGDMSMGKWYGNVRLKSRYRNIDLAAVGDESYVNIFTQGATIQVDATGNITLYGLGNIRLESPQDISVNAGQNVSIYGGTGVQIGSGGNLQVRSDGNTQMTSVGDTQIGSIGSMEVASNAEIQIGARGDAKINGSDIKHNGVSMEYTAGRPGLDVTEGKKIDSSPFTALGGPPANPPPPGTQFVPNDYNDPTGAV